VHRGVIAAFGLVSIVLTSSAALTSSANAEDRFVPPSRIESPRGVALGTGARATAASTQAQADNPANLPIGQLYQVESSLAYDPTFKRFSFNASVVDSMTSRLAAGVSARTLLGNGEAGKNSGWEGRIGLGFPVIEQLSVGIGMRYANMKIADHRAVPERPRETPEMEPDRRFRLKGFTMDAALTLRPIPGLSIAGLAYNIIDKKSLLAPMMVGGSAGFSSGSLTLGGDVLVDLNKHKQFDGPKLLVGGGLEFLAGGAIPLRVGYQYDAARAQSAVTGGLGFVDARFGLLASLRQTVNQGSETSLFFAVQYFVQ
jgi:hypothetical protein